MAKVISFTNNKWWVGKTSTAVNLANILASKKKRVLLIDLDQQCNLSQAILWVDFDENKVQSGELFNMNSKVQMKDIIYKIDKYLSIIPWRLDDVFLLESELENIHELMEFRIKPALEKLKSVPWEKKKEDIIKGIEKDIDKTVLKKREWITILKNRLSEIKKDYDYIFIDLPPSVSRIPKNAWVASDYLLIPISDYFASYGTKGLIERMVDIKKNYNQDLQFCFFFNKVPISSNGSKTDLLNKEFRKIIHKIITGIMSNDFLKKSSFVFESYIRYSWDIEKSYGSGQSILDFKKSAVLSDYSEFIDEFLEKLK